MKVMLKCKNRKLIINTERLKSVTRSPSPTKLSLEYMDKPYSLNFATLHDRESAYKKLTRAILVDATKSIRLVDSSPEEIIAPAQTQKQAKQSLYQRVINYIKYLFKAK